MKVFICGKPRSGNRIIRRLLEPWIDARIVHGSGILPKGHRLHADSVRNSVQCIEGHFGPAVALMPIRSDYYRQFSTEPGKYELFYDMDEAECEERVLVSLRSRAVPLMIFSYRDLVEHSSFTVARIMKFLGLWPVMPDLRQIEDGDEKWRRMHPEDRERHRVPTTESILI